MERKTKWIASAVPTVALVAASLVAPHLAGAHGPTSVEGLTEAAFLAAGSHASWRPTPIPQPSKGQLRAAGLFKLPLAPNSARADLTAPPFSDPTKITNPLFPISDLRSAVLNGRVDGKPFRTETTLLPETRIIEWTDGQPVEVLVSQYAAYLGGRLQEVALDYYAQADDGSVWYLGEDVFNYDQDGHIADTAGTWLAGKEGPAAMIMPADPEVGQAFRPENIPGLVFEEVTVKVTGKTVKGPQGPVDGAMVGEELHDDGSFSDKVFAPGYGEFFSAHEGDVEAMALAVPTDALGGSAPPKLRALSRGAHKVLRGARERNWKSASATVEEMTAAWTAYQKTGVPPRLVTPTNRAITSLDAAVETRNPSKARHSAIDVALAALDLKLRYRAPAGIDLARFNLWVRQLLVDASDDDLGGVTIDVATLEWIRDRFVHTLGPVQVTRIDKHLEDLRDSVVDEDLTSAAAEARHLRRTLAELSAESPVGFTTMGPSRPAPKRVEDARSSRG